MKIATNDFIKNVATRSNVTCKNTKAVYDALRDELENIILNGDTITFRELFTLGTKVVPEAKCNLTG